MRQIMIGKARPEYRRYVVDVAPEKRDPSQPSTPDPRARVSKRQFDRALSEWRRRLHEFDSAPWAFAQAQSWADAASENCPPPLPHEAASQKPTARKQRSARNNQQQNQVDMAEQGIQHCGPGGREGALLQEGAGAGVVQLRLADQLLGDASVSPVGGAHSPWAMTPDPSTPSANGRLRPGLVAVQMSDITPDEKTLAPMHHRLALPAPDPNLMVSCFMMNPMPHYQVPVEAVAAPDVDLSILPHAVHHEHRWPSPPKQGGAARERLASPQTPPRPRRIFGPSPPSSAIRTPNRGPWMTETPSPDRMYHASQRLQPHPEFSAMQPHPEMSAIQMGSAVDMCATQLCGQGWLGGWPVVG